MTPTSPFKIGVTPPQKSALGIYLHVPFCPHICPYCNFVKTSRFSKKDIGLYLEACLSQLHFFLSFVENSTTHVTVYLGGGTPSLIPASYYERFLTAIRNRFHIEELTIETNPFTNTSEALKHYKALGFDRLTLGAQSLCDTTLTFLGRKHTRKDILSTLKAAREAGFSNLQVDLIYGLKEGIRTISLEEELRILLDEGATGISTYALTIEKDTSYEGRDFANDERALKEYEDIVTFLSKTSFIHFETSNFSLYPMLHNNIYWHGLPYLGIGTGASGLLPPTAEHPFGRRYSVGKPKAEFYEKGNHKFYFSKEIEKEFEVFYEPKRTKEQYVEEFLFTILRTKEGLPKSWVEETFSLSTLQRLLTSPKVLEGKKASQLEETPTHLRLTSHGKVLGDRWGFDLSYELLKDF
jgi:oxygen-independent coproporphyrinogen-3 oxidase